MEHSPSPSARAIFDHAVEVDSPARRQAYLAEAWGDDAGLRQTVNALLRAYANAGSFLESAATSGVGEAATVARAYALPLREGPGSVVSRYKLLQEMGEGG